MFRPYDTLPSPPPSRPDNAMTSRQHLDGAASAMPQVHAPLPSNWEQMELDQRVRCIGEW